MAPCKPIVFAGPMRLFNENLVKLARVMGTCSDNDFTGPTTLQGTPNPG